MKLTIGKNWSGTHIVKKAVLPVECANHLFVRCDVFTSYDFFESDSGKKANTSFTITYHRYHLRELDSFDA
jgi:hypothetical protein